MPRYRLHVRKDSLGFSAAHFTLFPDGRAERLHGHNYRTELEIEGESLSRGLLLDFSELKNAARGICGELDERTLLPLNHDSLEVIQDGEYVEARLGTKVYRLPAEDVALLPLENTSVEELARHVGERLVQELGGRLTDAGVLTLSVGVEETPGQCGTWQVTL